MSLRVERRNNGDGALRLILSGAIDERADLAALFVDLPPSIVIDLGGIERINSIGIKRWVPILSTITLAHRTFVEAISYPVALQASCTSNLFGRAEIRSCNAPYYCTHCRASQNVLVTRDEFGGATDGVPSKNCPRCQKLMSFDDIDGFFSFFQPPSS